MRKMILTAMMIALIAGTTTTALAASAPYENSAINIQKDGVSVNLGNACPISYQDTTYLPVRKIAEVYNTSIDWDQRTRTVLVKNIDKTMTALRPAVKAVAPKDITKPYSDTGITIMFDGKVVNMTNVKKEAVYAVSKNGTTYIPVRFIGEMFNSTIGWNEASKTITITSEGTAVTPPVVEPPAGEIPTYEKNGETYCSYCNKELFDCYCNSEHVMTRGDFVNGYSKPGYVSREEMDSEFGAKWDTTRLVGYRGLYEIKTSYEIKGICNLTNEPVHFIISKDEGTSSTTPRKENVIKEGTLQPGQMYVYESTTLSGDSYDLNLISYKESNPSSRLFVGFGYM